VGVRKCIQPVKNRLVQINLENLHQNGCVHRDIAGGEISARLIASPVLRLC